MIKFLNTFINHKALLIFQLVLYCNIYENYFKILDSYLLPRLSITQRLIWVLISLSILNIYTGYTCTCKYESHTHIWATIGSTHWAGETWELRRRCSAVHSSCSKCQHFSRTAEGREHGEGEPGLGQWQRLLQALQKFLNGRPAPQKGAAGASSLFTHCFH